MAPETGVLWRVNEESGKVSTTASGKRIWTAGAQAMAEAEPAIAAESAAVQKAIVAEKDWRHKYVAPVGTVCAMAAASPAAAYAQAEASLVAFHDALVFQRGERSEGLLAAAADVETRRELLGGAAVETSTVKGAGHALPEDWEVSVPSDTGAPLRGASLSSQVEAWAAYGSCEPSVAASVKAVVDGGKAFAESVVNDRLFVLLGATSELGAARPLLGMGATVAAIARPGRKLASLAEFAASTTGTLLVPTVAVVDAEKARAAAAAAAAAATAAVAGESSASPPLIPPSSGLDLLKQLPEAAEWVCGLARERAAAAAAAGKTCTVVLCSYVYLDGEKHVRAVAAMDAVAHALLALLDSSAGEGAKGLALELSYLGSPSTPHPWAPEAEASARARWAERSWATRMAGFRSSVDECGVTALTLDKAAISAGGGSGAEGSGSIGSASSAALASELPAPPTPMRLYNGCMVLQGPNYALAKTAQLWRAILVARGGGGTFAAPTPVPVSFNYAPPGRTESMVHAPTMAKVLDGMQNFAPNLVLEAPSCSSLMAILLLADLGGDKDAKAVGSQHPWDMLTINSFHGGCDRCCFSLESIGSAVWVLGNLKPIKGTVVIE